MRSVVAFAERQTYHHFEVIGFLLPEKFVEPFQVYFVHNLSLERLGRLSVKVGIGGEEGFEPRLLVELIQQLHILGQAVLGPPFVEVSYIHIVTESYLTVGYLCIQSKVNDSVESYTVFIPELLCVFHHFAPSERGKLTLYLVRIRRLIVVRGLVFFGSRKAKYKSHKLYPFVDGRCQVLCLSRKHGAQQYYT